MGGAVEVTHVTSCLNPYHLQWGTQKENLLHSHPGGFPRDMLGRFSSSGGGGASHVPSSDDDDDDDEEDNNNNNSNH